MREFKYLLGLSLFFTISGAYAADAIHNIIGCEIFSMEKKLLRKFPGELCAFTDDGNVLATEEDRIVYYDKNLRPQWSLPIKAHHQVNLNLKKNKFLVIGSMTVKPPRGSPARTDKLYILNKKGEIEKTFDLYEQRAQFDQSYWSRAEKRQFPIVWTVARFSDAKWELTHVNSFYEIPDNAMGAFNPAFKSGHFIVNDISLMLVFVLSADLKKILWQSSLSSKPWTMFHDVQVRPSGHLLYYDNGTKDHAYSSLVEYDLRQDKIVWEYSRTPKKDFYAPRWGGVQQLDNGHILFSDITTNPISIEINRDGKEVWSMKSPPRTYLQQIKRQDLKEFLYHNKGL